MLYRPWTRYCQTHCRGCSGFTWKNSWARPYMSAGGASFLCWGLLVLCCQHFPHSGLQGSAALVTSNSHCNSHCWSVARIRSVQVLLWVAVFPLPGESIVCPYSIRLPSVGCCIAVLTLSWICCVLSVTPGFFSFILPSPLRCGGIRNVCQRYSFHVLKGVYSSGFPSNPVVWQIWPN